MMKSVIQEERSCLGNSQEESTEPISSFTIATPFSIHYCWKEKLLCERMESHLFSIEDTSLLK